jgi:hypothetical protein
MIRASLLLAALVVASNSINSASARPATIKRATFPLFAITFTYPSHWRLYRPVGDASSFTTVFAYLGNVPLSDPCTRTPSSRTCSPFSLSSIPSRTVLVRWSENGFPGWTLRQAKGRMVKIAGRPAKLDIEHRRADYCPINTSETIDATITRTPGDWFEMVACLSGPNLGTRQAQVLAMLHSVQNAG